MLNPLISFVQVKGADAPAGAMAAAIATFLDNLTTIGSQGSSASRSRSRSAVVPAHVQVGRTVRLYHRSIWLLGGDLSVHMRLVLLYHCPFQMCRTEHMLGEPGL